jgi:hypothetical protein
MLHQVGFSTACQPPAGLLRQPEVLPAPEEKKVNFSRKLQELELES